MKLNFKQIKFKSIIKVLIGLFVLVYFIGNILPNLIGVPIAAYQSHQVWKDTFEHGTIEEDSANLNFSKANEFDNGNLSFFYKVQNDTLFFIENNSTDLCLKSIPVIMLNKNQIGVKNYFYSDSCDFYDCCNMISELKDVFNKDGVNYYEIVQILGEKEVEYSTVDQMNSRSFIFSKEFGLKKNRFYKSNELTWPYGSISE